MINKLGYVPKPMELSNACWCKKKSKAYFKSYI
jgi:hypothetical protein